MLLASGVCGVRGLMLRVVLRLHGFGLDRQYESAGVCLMMEDAVGLHDDALALEVSSVSEVEVEVREIGGGDVESESMAHVEQIGRRVALDGALLSTARLQQLGGGARLAESASTNAVRDLH